MKSLFSDREIRAAAIFLPLAVLTIAGLALLRSRADPELARTIETRMETPDPTPDPAPFDPNTVDFDGLLRMGLTRSQAVTFLHYRASGRVFRLPEDVALCRGLDDSTFRSIRPYIRIGRQFAIAPAGHRRERIVAPPLPLAPFRIDTVSARYLHATGLLSPRQAETFINWRNSHPLRDMDDVRKSYVIGDSLAAVLAPYIVFADAGPSAPRFPIEINGADSAALLSVRGIGPKTAGAIVRYRQRLGGFVSTTQLAEVPGVTESNYEKISQQIRCESCNIRKIDINFATSEQLRNHPYIDRTILRRLHKAKLLKGGWSTAEEFRQARILDPETTERLIPYLHFGSRSGSDEPQTIISGDGPQPATRCDSVGEPPVPAP